MGMDVYGKAPSGTCAHGAREPHGGKTWCQGPPGAYFRNNWWWWRPLWDYCYVIAPDLISEELHAQCHSNDGAGLNAKDARALGERLEESLGGTAQKYERSWNEKNAAIPDEDCEVCGGTGHRAAPPVTGPGPVDCNGCQGTGRRRPSETWYPFSADNVREFAEFLKACGGFECH